MRDRLIHKIMSLNKPTISLQTAEDIVDAIIDEGVTFPPVKVGDIVFVYRWKRKRPRGGYYNSICYTSYQIKYAKEDNEIYIATKKATETDIKKMGYTVFKTRIEAEKALEKF